ncbi:MAG TPA: aspartate aminotransferase family protein [Chloroflexi bacterium]|nr:aspartate aminotransferase family protein [Chloroflexota bacterium]
MPSPQETEALHTSGVYAKRNLTIVRGKGALVWDDRGREYVDCAAGHGVASLGHSHPKVVQAIREQAEKIITCPEMFYNPVRAALLEKLTALAPAGMERVFLSNSGTEAVEAAFKFARYSTGRTEIIAAMRGFHGRTMGALSATWNKKYRQPFQPLVPEIRHVPYNKPERLAAAVSEKTAAVILEVVQGEGGVNPGTAEFLRGAQEICRQRGALLIIDEVQTGFGRTGRMFALEHHDLQPDILCVAKALGGGVPIGATLLGERVRELHPGLHGSTFGGNPLSAAAAVAALDALVEENLPQRAAETGAYLMEALRRIESPLIREVRGLGLMIGVELKQKVAPYLTALQERGVLALNAGMNVIRLLPPLVLTQEQADRVVKAVEEVMKGEG